MTRASVEKKVDSFVEGNLEHATEALFALLDIAAKDESVGVSSDASSAVSSPRPVSRPVLSWVLILHQSKQIRSPAHWDSVKAALISSIRTGVFFDRKCWARHSKSADMLKPVYFSSRIMNDKARRLDECRP